MCVIVTLAGCSAPAKQAADPVNAARPIEQVAWDAIAGGAAVIDVRTDSEFQEGHLPGAINIPYDQITSRLAELPSDRSQPIVLYCRSGRRSGIALDSLEELGFTNAINAGGYESMMRARPR
jgi:phage shock protein E